VVLHQGRVALEGTPHEVFRDLPRLRSLQLDLPEVAELSWCLRRRGVPLQGTPLDPAELASQLLRVRGVVA
jgi:hypothetical protein